jgi:protein-S-isoprenylcysteine O-methyltransferase Ste14
MAGADNQLQPDGSALMTTVITANPMANPMANPTANPAATPRAAGVGSSRWLRLRPPQLARGLVLAALLLHFGIWGFNAPLGRWLFGGLALIFSGLAVMLWAWWRFRQARTPVLPTAMPQRLVDEGPYRFSRNPMYLGLLLMMLGLAWALGVPVLALAAMAFAAVVQRVHIPHEEAALRRAFGGWYSDYAATVRRWL